MTLVWYNYSVIFKDCITKGVSQVEKNREGYLVSETHRECTKCGTFFEKTSKMTLCKSCNSERVKSQTPEWKMHQRAKQRCKGTDREFNLEVSDIVIPDFCPILGIKLNMNSGKSGAYRNSPSLDRIDNSKGYTKDNIQVISQLANAMKCHASNKELHMFAQWVISTVPATE
jgi:predicted  nucleic acid-binding Zn-ribbon protein